MIIQRTERHNISRGSPFWKACDELCFKSKNMYNYANYIMRQSFINKEGIIKYGNLTFQLKTSEPFKDLGSNSSQYTLKLLCRDWKSFMELLKKYNKNPSSLLGRPKLPKYKDKNGRHICVLTNWQSQIHNGYLYFAFKPLRPFNDTIKTKVTGKHLQTRIVPRGGNYILEIVYEKEVIDIQSESKNIASIDLGVNNFVTIANNIDAKSIIINGRGVKSYNVYWNKQMAKYKSLAKTNNKLDWTKRQQRLTNKRNNKMEYFMHKASKEVINYCLSLGIDTLVVGLNKEWKQESNMFKSANQTFVQIPYDKFINKLAYKCEDVGIKFIVNNESYTSGTSFLDNETSTKENYNKSRRIVRGLFKSNNGTLINSDLNGAYQIMKKVFPNAFANGILGVDLHPVVINLT
jgi:putative transposase